jgi:hypothetical protein
VKQLVEDAAMITYAAVLILLMAALFWVCRISGLDLDDDF